MERRLKVCANKVIRSFSFGPLTVRLGGGIDTFVCKPQHTC